MSSTSAVSPFTLLAIAPILLILGCQSAPKIKSDGSDARQIYDMRANGQTQLSAALATAQEENKLVLLSLGANWCSDSQNTYDVIHQNSELQQLVENRYILTLIDVNNRVGFQRNPSIIARYGVELDRGIPALLVLAPDGTLMSTDPDQRPEDSDHKEPKKLVNYLMKWQRP